MILETVCVGPMEVNCYILAEGEDSPAIIIDPGAQARKIKKILDNYGLSPAFIINTHGHYDHIGSDDEFGVPVYAHRKEVPLLKDPKLNLSGFFALPYKVKAEIKILEEGSVLELGDIQLKIMHMPGHSPGGIALLMQKPTDKVAFTGDSLLREGIGRSDLEGGDEVLLIQGIKEKLLILTDDTVIYPGHGPASTIGEEKRNNLYLK
jgi:glyoxylase-like metal-dependent hydrolase (beta-lactamase superfamily II)